MASKYPLSKKDFAELEIPDLVINICEYKDNCKNDLCLLQYLLWCIECLEEKCHTDEWIKDVCRPFSVFLDKILTGVHNTFIKNISYDTKQDIYSLIIFYKVF